MKYSGRRDSTAPESSSPFRWAINRRLIVTKFRRRTYRSGWHDFTIAAEGIRVFPTLILGEYPQVNEKEEVLSDNDQLDALLGGGLNWGSSAAIIGASGTGKSTMATTFAVAAARRGEHVVIYLFDETKDVFLKRAKGMGLEVDGLIKNGLMTLCQLNVGMSSGVSLPLPLFRPSSAHPMPPFATCPSTRLPSTRLPSTDSPRLAPPVSS